MDPNEVRCWTQICP